MNKGRQKFRSVQKRKHCVRQDDFKWRTREGEELTPQQMTTPHLFFVLQMFWNHSAPDEYKIEPYKRYDLSSFSPDYVKQAVQIMHAELERRDDLTDTLIDRLEFMRQSFYIMHNYDRLSYGVQS